MVVALFTKSLPIVVNFLLIKAAFLNSFFKSILAAKIKSFQLISVIWQLAAVTVFTVGALDLVSLVA